MTVEGFRHNRQAWSVPDVWAPDFQRGASDDRCGLLLMTGTGLSNVKMARVDVIMALDRVEGNER
ncbi:hypothetical protein C8A05DRAFT_37874 [Staphylotrichum tortipilum]|uniref:Uncharacterized protein n=1 Tax=Staphylotrichum tortipilum TaxID=2831512 RepID=A0AAN6MD07_9PEZI|nr:hypothetical protein C8A05DRAFT_37874 [Staphylotrichum longicolle]